MSVAPRRAIAAITVGTRHRRDFGDIEGLAASISDVGLLHPIVIRPDGTLIAGERRLQAAQALGWADVPVTIIDLDAVVRGEFAENSLRKDFTLSEAVAIKAGAGAARARRSQGAAAGGWSAWR
jgi:ParB family chromosome partitioning protein